MLSDFLGRRPVLGIADVIFIGGAIGQAVCHTVWSMIGGRFLIGIGVGIAACVAPLYIQELSPTRLRGRMVVVNVVAITGGQVVAYGIDAAFENMSGGWRWMVGLGAVPAAVQFVSLFFLPESRVSPLFDSLYVPLLRCYVCDSTYPDQEGQDRRCSQSHVQNIRTSYWRTSRPQSPRPQCCSQTKCRDRQLHNALPTTRHDPHEPH